MSEWIIRGLGRQHWQQLRDNYNLGQQKGGGSMRGPDRSIACLIRIMRAAQEQSARKTIEIWVKVEAAMEGIFIEHIR